VTAARLTLAALLAACSLPAAAQDPRDRPVHRFEVTVGAMWVGGGELGASGADLRANRTPPAPFTVFRTDTRINSAPGFDGRVGFWFTRSLVVEGGFVYAQPVVRTHVSGDIEGGETFDADEHLDQYFMDASASLMLDRLTFWDVVPFVEGGGGYLRQLHETRTFVQTGQVYHAGGGVRRWLSIRDRGFIRAMGVRVDARAYFLRDGFSLDGSPRSHGAISGAVFFTF
jgi:hypothetical protein